MRRTPSKKSSYSSDDKAKGKKRKVNRKINNKAKKLKNAKKAEEQVVAEKKGKELEVVKRRADSMQLQGDLGKNNFLYI